jgi:phage gp36-like protein
MTQYATYQNLIARYDSRIINELSNDNDDSNPNLTNIDIALQDASSEIMLSCLAGEIYSKLDLDLLYANGDNSLIRLTCELAAKNLFTRRLNGAPSDLKLSFDWSEMVLNQIREGIKVFYSLSSGNLSAGVADYNTLSQQTLFNQGSNTVLPFWSNRGTVHP